MSALKLPLLVDLQQKIGKLFFSVTSCPSVLILENKSVYKKCDYGNLNHWYNVSPIHLHVLSGVGNFTKVVRVFRRPHMKWSAIAESLRTTGLDSYEYV
jgi:hypothetical protein